MFWSGKGVHWGTLYPPRPNRPINDQLCVGGVGARGRHGVQGIRDTRTSLLPFKDACRVRMGSKDLSAPFDATSFMASRKRTSTDSWRASGLAG